MSCYHPVRAWKLADGGVVFKERSGLDVYSQIELPCGQCLGCRLRRSRDWSIRCMHEAQMWKENCFITLTYDEKHLPRNGSLDYRHFQLFMMRMRVSNGPDIRFFMCGEYGEQNFRPHYHACLFNKNFWDREAAGRSGSGMIYYRDKELTRLWGKGRAVVQDMNMTTAAYTARYCVDKMTGDLAKIKYGEKMPEFMRCSLKPGIGQTWFDKYWWTDAYRHDFVILDGQKYPTPRYYDKLYRRKDKTVRVDAWEFARYERAQKGLADNTDERREVREIVHQARVRNLKREL